MNANMKNFLIELSKNEELKNELKKTLGNQAGEISENLKKLVQSVSEFAKEKGYDVDSNSVLQGIVKVDEEELDAISGGLTWIGDDAKLHGSCSCIAGGSGSSDEFQKTCVCVIGGGGELTDFGSGAAILCDDKGFLPLVCVLVGASSK